MIKTPTLKASKNYKKDWIELFMEQTEHMSAPKLFRKWAAISCVAGALERRVWVHTLGSDLYPNFYIIFVAKPGIGKTILIDHVRRLWNQMEGAYIASSYVSRASLADELDEAVITSPGQNYNSLLAPVNELGTFMPTYDGEFMATLTDLYDCNIYKERKRGRGTNIEIENPQLNILSGTTPGHLHRTLPEGAWDEGFLSRCILVYSGERVLSDLFEVAKHGTKVLEELLQRIRRSRGRFDFTPEARDLITAWHRGGGEPLPRHPKLSHYATRRTAHALKLSQVISISASPRMVIEKEHIQTSIDFLVEAEVEMENIFKVMTSGGDSSIISEAFHFLTTNYIRGKKKPIAPSRLNAFLMTKTDAWRCQSIIEMMTRAGMIKLQVHDGRQGYVPQTKGHEL